MKAVRDYSGITLEALKRDLSNTETEKAETQAPVMADTIASGDKTVTAARYVLYAALFNKPFAEEQDFSTIEFVSPVHKRIAEYIEECKREKTAVRFNDLYTVLDGNSAELDLIAALQSDEQTKFDKELYYYDCLKTIKTYSLDKKLEILNSRFKEETDAEVRRGLIAEINAIIVKRKELN